MIYKILVLLSSRGRRFRERNKNSNIKSNFYAKLTLMERREYYRMKKRESRLRMTVEKRQWANSKRREEYERVNSDAREKVLQEAEENLTIHFSPSAVRKAAQRAKKR